MPSGGGVYSIEALEPSPYHQMEDRHGILIDENPKLPPDKVGCLMKDFPMLKKKERKGCRPALGKLPLYNLNIISILYKKCDTVPSFRSPWYLDLPFANPK